jgi:hypothetical protein
MKFLLSLKSCTDCFTAKEKVHQIFHTFLFSLEMIITIPHFHINQARSKNGGKRNIYRLVLGKPKGTRPLGRSRYKWVDNIKMGLVERGLGGVDWIGLAQDRESGELL